MDIRERVPRPWAIAAGLAAIALFFLVPPSAVFACEPYVVDELSSDRPHPWHAQAVLDVEVSRVDEAGPDFINRNPLGYQLSVRRTLRGHDIPATFEVVRANGCDSIKLTMGERLVVAVGQGADLRVPMGTEPGFGADNYNSAWYRRTANGTISLVRGSAWVAGIEGRSTVAELLAATASLPPTDSLAWERGAESGTAPVVAALAIALAVTGAAWITLRLRFRPPGKPGRID
jgi:hypothetical protein